MSSLFFKAGGQSKDGFLPLAGVVFLLLAAAAVFSVFRDWHPVPGRTSAVLSLDSIQKLHSTEVISRSAAALRIRLALRKEPYIVIPLQKQIRNTKLHLFIGEFEKVKQIRIYPGLVGKPYSKKNVILLPVGKAGGYRHHFNAILPDGDYDRLRVDFKSGDHFGIAEILGVSLHPAEVRDQSFWVYALAFLVAVFILLPGILLFPLIHRDATGRGVFLSLFTGYSVGYYVILYLLWAVSLNFWPVVADPLVLVIVFLGFPLLCWLGRRREIGVAFYVRRMRKELLIYLAALMASCFLVVWGSNLPLENTWYTSISGHAQSKTYSAFQAHDAVFHYVNGVAISNDEPFEKYYGNRKLFYGVEDRGILPGALYGILRSMLRNFSPLLADSYLIYTILGMCFNLMVLFPVFAFVRRYTGAHNLWLFSLAFSLNAFILVNYYLTWFKMAGAAFFLAGLYLMFQARDRSSWEGWGLSGMLLGIGANMHAGSALGIPFFFLWAVWQNFKGKSSSWIRTLTGPAMLIFCFAATNLPWTMVKKLYFNDQYRLIKEHFLAGYSDPAGIGRSAALFFFKIPLSEQLGHRFERLWGSFRFPEIGNLIHALQSQEVGQFCRLWNRYEFTYTAFVIYPFLFLFLMTILRSLRVKHANPGKPPMGTGPSPLPATQMALSGLTLFTIIFLSYGSHAPDITYHQPMGVVVLLYLLLIGKVMAGSRAVRLAMYAYLSLAAFRLTFFFG